MTAPQLQRLLDTADISDAIHAFCDFNDRGDLDGLMGLFTQDGLFDMGGGAVHRGRAELRALFIDRFKLYRVSNLHCSGTRLKAYDGATASTTTSLYAFHDAPDQNLQMQTWGRYEDEFVLVDGDWKIRERHLLVAGIHHTTSDQIPERFSPLRRVEIPES